MSGNRNGDRTVLGSSADSARSGFSQGNGSQGNGTSLATIPNRMSHSQRMQTPRHSTRRGSNSNSNSNGSTGYSHGQQGNAISFWHDLATPRSMLVRKAGSRFPSAKPGEINYNTLHTLNQVEGLRSSDYQYDTSVASHDSFMQLVGQLIKPPKARVLSANTQRRNNKQLTEHMTARRCVA